MSRTRKSYVLLAAMATLLVSMWRGDVSLAQGRDPDRGHGERVLNAGPPYGPPELGRNPGEERREIRYGPLTAVGTDHPTNTGNVFMFNIEKPCSGCQVTSMTARLLNAEGEEMGPPQGVRLKGMMLLQGRFAGRDDATCGSGANWQPTGPNFLPYGEVLGGERFFLSGDERTPVTLPQGYGYPVGNSSWTMIYELANSNSASRTVYIEMVYDYVPGDTLHDADPVWFDIDQCGWSATNMEAGDQTGTYTWNVTRPGSVLFAAGYQHGNWVNGAVHGGVNVELRIGGADGQVICDSRAGYGESPFYRDNRGVKWLSSMSTCGDLYTPETLGLVAEGEQMTITSQYSHQEPWRGQMGGMLAYISREIPDPDPHPQPGYPYGADIRAEASAFGVAVPFAGDSEDVARFPMGGEGACNDEGARTTLTGSFSESHDGRAFLSDVEFTGQPGDVLATDDGAICAVIDFAAAGGKLEMQGSWPATFSLYGVTAEITLTATGQFAPFITGDCVLDMDIGEMIGTIRGSGPPNLASVTASEVTMGEAPEGCDAYGTLLNVYLGLPSSDAAAALELEIHWED